MKIFAILPLFLLLFACDNAQRSIHGQTMGTTYHIEYLAQKPLSKIIITTYLKQFSAIFSSWDKDSELSRLNQAPIKNWLAVSASLSYLTQVSQMIHQQSQGYFDVTMGWALKQWGFYGNHSSILPNNTKNGMIFLQNKPRYIKKHANIQLDLSAIAKGYAIDGLAIILQKQGVNNFMIEIGGEVLVRGNKGKAPWRVGLVKTTEVLVLNNQSIATSGNYHNFIKQDKQRYGHIFNPKTKQPVKSAFLSVSVIHQSTMLADAYATAIMAMPIKTAKQFIKNQQLSVILVYDNPKKTIEKINLRPYNSLNL